MRNRKGAKMIQKISIQPYQIKNYTVIGLSISDAPEKFPFLSIDRDSYIVGAEIQSGLNFDFAAGRHCVAIGKGCSLAESITLVINLDHHINAVFQGAVEILEGGKKDFRQRRKGTILIQNDVWVGHGATIMNGVTLHNGCVVGTNAMVTKDVPPYAIVGGNPARVLRYRFDEEIIDGLQKIAWWDWPDKLIRERRDDFFLPPEEFVKKYLPDIDICPPKKDILQDAREAGRRVVLFVPDVESPWPLYPSVLEEYFSADRPHAELVLYLPRALSQPRYLQALETELGKYEEKDSYVTLQTGKDLDERILFQYADYFVTTRARQTVARSCLADRYGVKTLYGTDTQLFPAGL